MSSLQVQTNLAPCAYAPGDLVMFARRCQTTAGGMRVEEVDANMFDALVKVDGHWWHPDCFMSFEDWKRQFSRPLN